MKFSSAVSCIPLGILSIILFLCSNLLLCCALQSSHIPKICLYYLVCYYYIVYSLISNFNGTNHITLWFLLLVSSIVNMSNCLSSSTVLICSFLTSCLFIPILLQLKAHSVKIKNMLGQLGEDCSVSAELVTLGKS